jgi:cytochrome c-type biogenesis protein CcmE
MTLLLTLLALAIAGTLVTLALQRNIKYLLTPTEVVTGHGAGSRPFRLGGVVCEGSVARIPGTLDVHFVVTDRVHQVPVHYTGILPDLFREGQSVIASGRMDGRAFRAEEVLAKHDETYMPKEVADAIALGKKLPHTPCKPPSI